MGDRKYTINKPGWDSAKYKETKEYIRHFRTGTQVTQGYIFHEDWTDAGQTRVFERVKHILDAGQTFRTDIPVRVERDHTERVVGIHKKTNEEVPETLSYIYVYTTIELSSYGKKPARVVKVEGWLESSTKVSDFTWDDPTPSSHMKTPAQPKEKAKSLKITRKIKEKTKSLKITRKIKRRRRHNKARTGRQTRKESK